MEEQTIKLVLLRERSEYLIGSITELDEEPSLLIEKCMEVLLLWLIVRLVALLSAAALVATKVQSCASRKALQTKRSSVCTAQ